jgi:predicted RNA-binding Zn-ribbon protein involved in translation (DUF1610 family)
MSVTTPAENEVIDDSNPSGDFTIDRCSSCATRIALRSPLPDSPASAWLCRRCGSVYFARCQEKDGQPFSAGTRLVSYYEVMKAINTTIDTRASSIPQKDVQRLVQSLSARPYNGREARRQKRHPVAAPVTVVPLGADFRVSGAPARVMTLNVSSGGCALVHSRRIVEPYLAIDFSTCGIDILPAVLKVIRVRTLAAAFEVAGQFQSRILH